MIEPTGWIQGITSQFFYFVCYVCLITNHWDKKWSDTSFCVTCLGCLWQCYRNTYASGLLLGWLFLVLFRFSLIERSLRHWFITKRNYLVSIFCLLGKGNNRQWSPGLYTPTGEWCKPEAMERQLPLDLNPSFPVCDQNQEHSELGGWELFKALQVISLSHFFRLDAISCPAMKHWEKE